jgi:uncharacterized protein (DUF488 family)
MKGLVTIGYEGATPDDFIATLQSAGVDCLLDVRELPLSRRKGFSKTALRDLLHTHGLAYEHEKRLGSPKVIRHQLRADKDLTKFMRDFETYIDTQQAVLNEVAQRLTGTVALMCYERDYTTCHRRVVADKLSYITGVIPQHLCIKHGITQYKYAHTRLDFSESLSTTQ